MFNDINISKDLIDEFKGTQQAQLIAANNVDFSAKILTNGIWPDQQQARYILPPEIK
jgi:hypothetical protein